MTPRAEQNAAEPESRDRDDRTEGQGGPLVPLYGFPGVARGVQAFRRGDVILYTVRGEPDQVMELVGQLHKQGVREVAALISHHADAAPSLPEAVEQDEGGPDREDQDGASSGS